jgi:imidazolonepropionase-like amidohydrolase
MKRIYIIVLLVAVQFNLAAQATKGSLLIRNGTVITITKGTLEATDVLVRDGKIAQIGKGIAVPAGVRVIDATGMFVMPGIIDAHSHVGLSAINEATNAITPEVFTGDVVDPFDINIYQALAGGVTVSHALHGSANSIGGQSETLKHRWGLTDPEQIKMENAPRTIKFALGENPTNHGRRNNEQPSTRMGVEFVIRKAFSEGKEYMEAWDKYNKDKQAKGFRGAPPAYSLRLQTMADIIKGDIIVHCHSYRADEINMLLRVCKDFGVKRIVFQHTNEGFKVAPELAAYGAMASVFADWWAYKLEVYYSTAYNAAILSKNGVVTSINSDSGELIRHLYHEAGKTQKYGGLTDDEALALITINPAKQLGVDSRIGSLEVGKDGDVAIFKNHPLSIYAIPMVTIVDGMVRFDREKDPDDMRLSVDPKVSIDVVNLRESERHHDNCMRGADLNFESFFGTDNK